MNPLPPGPEALLGVRVPAHSCVELLELPITLRIAWCLYVIEHTRFAMAREEAFVSCLTVQEPNQVWENDFSDQAYAGGAYTSVAGMDAAEPRYIESLDSWAEPEWGWKAEMESTLVSLSILAVSSGGLAPCLPDPVLDPLPVGIKARKMKAISAGRQRAAAASYGHMLDPLTASSRSAAVMVDLHNGAIADCDRPLPEEDLFHPAAYPCDDLDDCANWDDFDFHARANEDEDLFRHCEDLDNDE